MSLPTLRPERPRIPFVPILLLIVPFLVTGAGMMFLRSRSLKPVGAEIARLRKVSDANAAESARLAKEVDRLRREVSALQAVSRVEIVWGGAQADDKRITFPYQKHPTSPGIYTHPRDGAATVWYYTDDKDTLARIAAHPRVLGAAHLWPILASENGMQVSGRDELKAGRLIRVPARISEPQIRRAIVEAGASNETRNEIFAAAGIKP